MLKTTLAVALGAASIAGVAMAQPKAITDWQNAPYHPGSIAYPRADDPAWRRMERQAAADAAARRAELARTGIASDVSLSAVIPPPSHWTGGELAWRDHMNRCIGRYRTYNPETDMFYARPGVLERCRL